VFEPSMMPGGALAGSLGWLVGVGEGRGIALMFVMMGVLAMGATVLAYLYPPLRLVEDQLPTVNFAPASAEPLSRPTIPGEAISGQ
jgi:hypothetical protein